jgi:2-polyprenyl-6-methoxyphenol hydroxylase-like FAD-dependent oxidoreductase
MQTDVDVLIIGAGPAGAMAASILQREGFRLLVVEKQHFPRFVIGESLLPQSMSLLQESGLLESIEQKNFMQKNGAVFLRGHEECNFDFSAQFTAGWKYTYQVPRADFDKTLADAVASRGVEILYGTSVSAVRFEETHAEVTLSTINSQPSTRTVTAKFVLDCSGFGRVLPRLLDLEKPSTFPPREALFTHVNGDIRPEGREEGKVWVCIHPQDAWLWIIPFADGRTSIGAVAKPEFFARFSGTPEEQLRAIIESDPNAHARLANVKFLFPPQAIRAFACSVKQLWGPRYALVGNATEFLDPIFSSGVALAFASADRAAKVLTRHLRGEAVDWQTEYADYVMHGVNTFRAYVTAWYDGLLPNIFFAARANRDIMRQVCSVLAGYVWDKDNPYVCQPERALPLLAQIVRARAQAA